MQDGWVFAHGQRWWAQRLEGGSREKVTKHRQTVWGEVGVELSQSDHGYLFLVRVSGIFVSTVRVLLILTIQPPMYPYKLQADLFEIGATLRVWSLCRFSNVLSLMLREENAMAPAVRAALPSCFSDKYIAVVPSPYVSLPCMRAFLTLALNPLESFAPSASYINPHPLYLLHQACFNTILCLSYISVI
jgi:hypothetical protein